MDFFRKHKEAVLGVLFYLAIMIALLLFLGLYRPEPPPPEEGIVLDFGGSGSGTTDPGKSVAKKNNNNNNNNNKSNNTEEVKSSNPESNMTQDFEEAPEMPDYNTTSEEDNETDKAEEPVEEQKEEEEEKENEISSSVKDAMNTNWEETSDSEVDGSGKGNPGKGDNGEGGSGDGEGPGSGNIAGNGWSLAGRAAKSIPKPSVANCDGYVIVVIEVNRAGKVVNAYAKPGGCTACDSHCVSNAVKSAEKAKFNSDKSAKKSQSGTITYYFRPN